MRMFNTLRRGSIPVLVPLIALLVTTAEAKPKKAPAKPAKTEPAPKSDAANDPAAPNPATPTAAPAAGAPATSVPAAGTPATPASTTAAPSDAPPAVPPVDPETLASNLRLRRLEQQVQALKERAWRAKARTTQLKEAVLGGGIGAVATIVHTNKMGSSFRLIQLNYTLDGSQIFSRADSGNDELYRTKSFDILTGPITRGSHTLSVLAVYRGYGYGVFQYLTKYTFTVRSSHTFMASENKSTRIEAVGFEKGGLTTPLEKRPAIEFKVTVGAGEKL